MNLELNERERAAVLAALRFYEMRNHGDCEWANELATAGGEIEPLDEGELDELCSRINRESSHERHI